jgi:hypothetical protein
MLGHYSRDLFKVKETNSVHFYIMTLNLTCAVQKILLLMEQTFLELYLIKQKSFISHINRLRQNAFIQIEIKSLTLLYMLICTISLTEVKS